MCVEHHLCAKYPFQVNGRSTLCLVRKLSMLEEGWSSTMFPRDNWVTFERNNDYVSMFSNVCNTIFVPNSSPQVNGTRTESLVRKLSMSEAGVSSTFFPYENWVTCWKEHCLPLSIFMCVEHQLCVILLNSSEWNKHCFSSKKTINIRSKLI
jgi:hypothetical protein